MVKRDRKIAPKPATPPPAADAWVTSGGLDPETASPRTEPPKPAGKPYPHRVSFDMATEQYKRLKRACFEEDRSLNDAIRQAVEEWLKAKDY